MYMYVEHAAAVSIFRAWVHYCSGEDGVEASREGQGSRGSRSRSSSCRWSSFCLALNPECTAGMADMAGLASHSAMGSCVVGGCVFRGGSKLKVAGCRLQASNAVPTVRMFSAGVADEVLLSAVVHTRDRPATTKCSHSPRSFAH